MNLHSEISKYNLVLASSSVGRRSMLESVNIFPDIVFSPDVNEEVLKNEDLIQYCKRVSINKALKAQEIYNKDNDIIIAADTITVCGRKFLRKAKDKPYARYCIKTLSGRRHRIYSSVVVLHRGKIRNEIVKSTVSMKRMEEWEIDQYIASKNWMNKGGACSVQEQLAFYIKWFQGSFSNIIGLPLHETYKMLVSALQHRE